MVARVRPMGNWFVAPWDAHTSIIGGTAGNLFRFIEVIARMRCWKQTIDASCSIKKLINTKQGFGRNRSVIVSYSTAMRI